MGGKARKAPREPTHTLAHSYKLTIKIHPPSMCCNINDYFCQKHERNEYILEFRSKLLFVFEYMYKHIVYISGNQTYARWEYIIICCARIQWALEI